MEITKSIFREYDIRGIYPEEINESIVSLIAKAISYKCKEKNITEICVGRDGSCLLYTSPSPRDGW